MRFARFPALAALLVSALPLALRAQSTAPPPPVPRVNHPALLAMKWQLLAGSDTFGNRTVFDMIELLHHMTVHHLELCQQPLSSQWRQVRVDDDMPPPQLAALQARLKSTHMDIVSWLPGGPDGEAAWRRELAFARQLHVKNVITTQDPSRFLDGLANEFDLNIVTFYPPHMIDTAMMQRQLQGLSPRSGVLASVAAWQRSGGDPAAMIHALGSRVIEIHFSDVDAHGHSVPLGSGTVDVKAICAELKRQNFHGQMEVQWLSDGPPFDFSQQNERFVQAVNAFSSAVTAATGIPEKE